jgi:hypothetical protein
VLTRRIGAVSLDNQRRSHASATLSIRHLPDPRTTLLIQESRESIDVP